MNQSYTCIWPNGDITVKINDIPTVLTYGDSVELTSDEFSAMSDLFIADDNWKTIYDGTIALGVSTVTKTKTISGLDGTKKFITVTVEVDALSAANIAAGALLTAVIKNSAGTTLETLTHTFLAITAGNSESFVIMPTSLIAASGGTCVISVRVPQDAGNIITLTESFEVDDVANDVSAFTCSVGASVAAGNPIVASFQLKDSSFADLAQRGIVEAFAFETFDSLDTLTAFTTGTDGTLLGTLTANAAILCLSEADGDLDITATAGGASTCRIGIRVNGEIIGFSGELIWT